MNFMKMILTKSISSLQEKCSRIPVEDFSYDVTVRLISALTSFSYNAELEFLLPKITRLCMFSPISLGAKRKKKRVRSPLIVEFGNPVDQNIHLCYYSFWPEDISKKAQETQN